MADYLKEYETGVRSIDDRIDDEIYRLRLSLGGVSRYERALRMIAEGRISPAIGFARRVLNGQEPEQALKDELSGG